MSSKALPEPSLPVETLSSDKPKPREKKKKKKMKVVPIDENLVSDSGMASNGTSRLESPPWSTTLDPFSSKLASDAGNPTYKSTPSTAEQTPDIPGGWGDVAEPNLATSAARQILQDQKERRDKMAKLHEEARAAEEQRLVEEKRVADQKRVAEEKRIAEEKRVAKEKHLAEEARVAKDRPLAQVLPHPHSIPQNRDDDSDLEIEFPPPLSFSANCVCIRVAGPNLADLFFYDLPGIIANVRDGGNEGDIKLVKDLAHNYISRPSCIVLLAISCETDFENQGGGRLVLGDRKLRERTIGVLTKPDRCEVGNEYRWTSIIKGQESPLKNGWFAVKQPDSTQLKAGISWDEARANERHFFSTAEPWSDIRGATRQRLGSTTLTGHLSTMLSELVSERLPFIQDEVAIQLREVEDELRAMPARHFGDPCSEVLSKVMAFTMELSAHVKGIPEFGKNPGLMEALLEVYENFRNNIETTAPRFRPWVDGESLTSEARLEQLAEQGDHDDGCGQILYLDEVLHRTRRARTRELPGNCPFAVKEHLIKNFWSQWRSFVHICFGKVEEIMNTHIGKLVDKHFEAFVHGGLLQAVRAVVQSQLHEKTEAGIAKLESLFQVESLPFTQNEHYFFSYKAKLMTRYQSIHRLSKGEFSLCAKLQDPVIEDSPVPASDNSPKVRGKQAPSQPVGPHLTAFDEKVARALSSLADLGFEGLVRADLLRLDPPTEVDSALDIMAEVRAYWQVAYKRFADIVPLEVDHEYVRALDGNSHFALIMGLGLTHDGARERCAKWLEEDPVIVAKREELKARKRMLEAARESLASISPALG